MMVARVFVSHADANQEFAREVYRMLCGLGHQAFLAKDVRAGIQPGDVWKERLHQELRAADATVCVITVAYNASPWCAYEIGIAHEVGGLLLPLHAEPGVTSPLLDDRQHVPVQDNQRWAEELDVSLRRVDAARGLGWADDRSPFPGLRPFTRDMAKVFYGRGDELRRLTHRLRSLGEGRLLLVVGASGCGKSSLVTAGLPARLSDEPDWEVADAFLPGRDPVRKLARTLTKAANRADLRWEDVLQRLRDDDRALVEIAEELLTAGPGPARDKLLLIIDQGEELFTRSDETERARLVTLLRHALVGPVRMVIALRSEFQDQLFALPELHGVHLHTFPLRPLARDMLSVVITEPARVAGLNVERELVSRMVAETDGGEALPLLAFTLHELAKDQTRGGTLSVERYEELGGVRGALARRADAVLDDAVAASALKREELLAGMAELATLDEAGRRTRRRIELAELPSDALRTALEVFLDQRLLSTPSDSLGGTGVGVVHEALLTAWQPLDAAISEREAALLSEGQIERAAAEWEHSGAVWDADRLTAAITTLWQSYDRYRAGEDPVVNLNKAGRTFLAECNRRVEGARRRERQRRRRTIGVLSVCLIVALTGVVAAIWQSLRAQDAQRTAEQVQHRMIAQTLLVDAASVRSTDPVLALRLAVAAEAVRPHVDSQANLLQSLTADDSTTVRRSDPVTSMAFSPDAGILATGGADATILLWDTTARQPRRVGPALTGHTSTITSVTFSPGSRILNAVGGDGAALQWDVTNPNQPQPLGSLDSGQTVSDPRDAFSSDRRIEAIVEDGGIELWVTTDSGQRRSFGYLLAGAGPVRAVAFSPNGQVLASVGSGRTVWLWDVSGDQPRPIGQPLTGHTGSLLSLAFSPDGHMLASAGNDGTVRLWRLAAVDAFRDNSIVTYACSQAQGGLDRSAWSFYVPGVPYRDTCSP